jgi:hypothetical protein
MKEIITSVVALLASLAILDTAAAQAQQPEPMAATVTLQSSRPLWPIAREASGESGVVGERSHGMTAVRH